MPGPLPQPGRQLRPGRDLPWVDLPVEGRAEWPDPPAHLSGHGREWWNRNWASPAATQWGACEFDIAARRAELQDLWRESRNTRVLAEMRHLDTALGLTVKARKELRWRIVDGVEVVEENGRRLSVAERRRRIHLVERERTSDR